VRLVSTTTTTPSKPATSRPESERSIAHAYGLTWIVHAFWSTVR
jgi:hypothetical protein